MKKLLLLLLLFYITCSCQTSFEKLDSTIQAAIQDSIFPGASVLVGSKNNIIYKNSYGNYTYDTSSPEVKDNSLFDLASVTKAFGTNFCIMKLVDEGKLNINDPVAKYLPEFGQNGKEKVLVKDLLIHESGLKAYHPPVEGDTRLGLLDTIKALPCQYETNSKSVYSCLNFVTSMMVVEAITNKPMYKYYDEKFVEPLGLKRTMFTPSDEFKSECVPTTPELQGVVHDPLARALDGLSGNAGLYSTTEDLSVLCQLLLNKGTYNGERYLKEETINKFIKKNSDRSSRALGFDTRSEEGHATSGKYFSSGTFGHLGYTGTSIWIDPVREIFVVFLTNRVYPDDTKSIRKVRPVVHDAVIISLEGEK
ncbi:MAG: serine hydrolase [Melioribacteraceae bacterium]|nr:serine hydrolase [Melioribacteraceae bacterium]